MTADVLWPSPAARTCRAGRCPGDTWRDLRLGPGGYLLAPGRSLGVIRSQARSAAGSPARGAWRARHPRAHTARHRAGRDRTAGGLAHSHRRNARGVPPGSARSVRTSAERRSSTARDADSRDAVSRAGAVRYQQALPDLIGRSPGRAFTTSIPASDSITSNGSVNCGLSPDQCRSPAARSRLPRHRMPEAGT